MRRKYLVLMGGVCFLSAVVGGLVSRRVSDSPVLAQWQEPAYDFIDTDTVDVSTSAAIGKVLKRSSTGKWTPGTDEVGSGGDGTCDGTVLDIKFTNTTYNGNLGGVAGGNAKCASEYPGYRMLTKTDVEAAARGGCLPIASQYLYQSIVDVGCTKARGWIDGYGTPDADCNAWTGTTSLEQGAQLRSTTGYWQLTRNAATDECDDFFPVACCK